MGFDIMTILIPLGVGLGASALLLAVRRIILSALGRWAKRTETNVDDIIIETLRTPSLFWVFAVGLYFGIAFSTLPDKHAIFIDKTIHVVLILSVTSALSNLAGRLLKNYVEKTSLAIPATGLVYGILKGSIYLLGVIIILSALGISIAPLVTALGVGGLAVALALQDTLANLFAGIHILTEKSVRVGDYVKLDSGLEGHVVDITWRTARIRTVQNVMVIIPNNKLSQSTVTNYHLPEGVMTLQVRVGVGYENDPLNVQRVLLEEALKVSQDVEGAVSEPPPRVWFIPGFAESSMDFTVNVSITDVKYMNPVQTELRNRIWKRLKAEGMEIPYPHRVIMLRKED